ncbi:MAG: hypothetical protein A2Z34_04870 [Planctomycetes bacterium RBG_16_59_8]|nr:MAG: hypothetical protein A2Z34_04870 [Planctomycetes bacterium RBG_16_59_8]
MSGYDFGIPGSRLLQQSREGGRGNVILVIGEGQGAKVLKIFRRRSSAFLEILGDFTSWFIHGKTGFSVRCRYETEKRTHDRWSRFGMPVLNRLNIPVPPEAGGMAIWYEWCSGRRLSELMADDSIEWTKKDDLLEKLGSETGRRHDIAIREQEPLLVHEHSALKHFFVEGERLVGFDFEGGYGPRYALREAMADEFSGILRSIAQTTGDRYPEAFRSFARGYGNTDRLRGIAVWASSGGGIRRRLKRLRDFFLRDRFSKTVVLRRLAEMLGSDSSVRNR